MIILTQSVVFVVRVEAFVAFFEEVEHVVCSIHCLADVEVGGFLEKDETELEITVAPLVVFCFAHT